MLFNFHGKYGEKEKVSFQSAQEDDLSKICAHLKTNKSPLGKIRFEVFDTREGKQNADPNHSISRASARFNEMAIYRFWQSPDDAHFPHEITHLVAHTWAKSYLLETELDTWDEKKIKRSIDMVSTSFFQEGLAIAIDDIVFKRKLLEEGQSRFIDDWCRDQIDKMPKISQCINLEGFSAFDNKTVVPFAASLSKFLLNTYGLNKYKKLYVSVKEIDSVTENIKALEEVYGVLEADLLHDWKSSLFQSEKS